eukprot:2485504-Prymnesium_polylepis.2
MCIRDSFHLLRARGRLHPPSGRAWQSYQPTTPPLTAPPPLPLPRDCTHQGAFAAYSSCSGT